jgi:hypothetical protein
MKLTLPGLITIEVVDGAITGTNPGAVQCAETLLKGTNGRFTNDEVHPDMDYAIAKFLAEKMQGKLVNERIEDFIQMLLQLDDRRT